jgi:hypothetical protein
MSTEDWEQTMNDLRQEIASIKERARMFCMKLGEVGKQAGSFKVAFLNHRLEEQRRSLARTRGYTSIMRDRKRLGASLGAAAVGLILAGIISKDELTAINAGLSSFDATLRGLGETAWAVSLGKELTVLPKDNITSGKIWVTWESLKSALAQLEREASQGAGLGTLDSIISRLQTRSELVYCGLLEGKPIRLEGRER